MIHQQNRLPNAPMASAPSQVHVHVSLDVTFAANGVTPDVLESRVRGLVFRAVEDFDLAGNTGAESLSHSLKATAISPEGMDLDETALAAYFTGQIADGNLRIERIPTLMARYALANPAEMREAFADQIEQVSDDGDDAPTYPSPQG